jgi:hypothetical protein
MHSLGLRSKEVLTTLGPIIYRRSLCQCPKCAKTRFPGDEELDIVHTAYSPGVRRLVADFGSGAPFKRVSEQLRAAAGFNICRKECERIAEREGEAIEQWTKAQRARQRQQEPPPPEAPKHIERMYVEPDGTGIPMVPGELKGRKGKQKDGSAKTREAKIGCVFTQTATDKEGRPVRDPASTTYVAAIENAGQSGQRLFEEAVRRGAYEAKEIVVIGDGAEWVKNFAATHFPNSQFILDFYHAMGHIRTLSQALFDRDLKKLNRYYDTWCQYLKEGDIEAIINEATHCLPKDSRAKQDARTQVEYFNKNKDYMRYPEYRQKGMFIGSGVVEAGCKHLVGQRLKQSGMEWTERGANAILALRALVLSGRFEDYWEERAV